MKRAPSHKIAQTEIEKKLDPRVTNEVAIDALCIWEEALELCHQGDRSIYEWLCAPEGAYQARQHCIDLAPLLTAAWQQVQEVFDITYDWEFIPEALPLFAEKPFEEANTPIHADYVAKRLIRLHMMKEGPKTGAQLPLDLTHSRGT